MRQLIEVARTLDWRPLWISLKTGVLSTAVCFVLGILAAWRVMYCRGKHRSILDAILTLPMVLPPTVAGFFLLLFFSRRRPLGIFLFDHFGIKIVQSQVGCVIAASVIAFPLMYRSARAAFEQVDINLLYAGRTLGMSDPEIFFKVILPCARPGITSGTVLAFARGIRRHINAGRQYPGKNSDHFAKDRNGHTGSELPNGRCLGHGHDGHCADRSGGDRTHFAEK